MYHNVHNVVDPTGPSNSHVLVEYVQHVNELEQSPNDGSYDKKPFDGVSNVFDYGFFRLAFVWFIGFICLYHCVGVHSRISLSFVAPRRSGFCATSVALSFFVVALLVDSF